MDEHETDSSHQQRSGGEDTNGKTSHRKLRVKNRSGSQGKTRVRQSGQEGQGRRLGEGTLLAPLPGLVRDRINELINH